MKHSEMVAKLIKDPCLILDQMRYRDINMVHMGMGIAGEAGELLDAIKKCTMYNKPLDMANVIEELGDIEFYMEGLRQELGLTRDLILSQNVVKLGKRYSGFEYTDQKAKERADKS